MSTESVSGTDLAVSVPPVQVRELMDGHQVIFQFPNGYGASVVRHWGSYGGPAGLWELGVVAWDPDGSNWELTYDTDITNDVIGYLTPFEVDELLIRIRSLDAYGKEPEAVTAS